MYILLSFGLISQLLEFDTECECPYIYYIVKGSTFVYAEIPLVSLASYSPALRSQRSYKLLGDEEIDGESLTSYNMALTDGHRFIYNIHRSYVYYYTCTCIYIIYIYIYVSVDYVSV